MAKNTAFQAGATERTVYLRALVISTNLPYTAGAYNTAGLTVKYTRTGAAAASITLATTTASAVWTEGGFVHIDAGLYKLDLPDAALAVGPDQVYITASGVSDVIWEDVTIELLGGDPRALGVDLSSGALDDIVDASIAALDGFDADSTTMLINGVAHTISRHASGYILTVVTD